MHVLAQESAAFTTCHSDKKRSFADIHIQAKRREARNKMWDHAQRIKKLLTGVENAAQQKVIGINLHVFKRDNWLKLVSNIAGEARPDQR